MDSLSKMIAFLIAVVLMVVVPVYRSFWVVDQAVLKQINFETQEFVNNVRHKGFVSKDMYEEYVAGIAKTGYVYDIEFKHRKQVYYPDASGKPIVLDEVFVTKHILEALYSTADSNRYEMKKGDSFVINIKNKSKTGTQVFMSLLGGGAENSMLFTRYGGMITNEDY